MPAILDMELDPRRSQHVLYIRATFKQRLRNSLNVRCVLRDDVLESNGSISLPSRSRRDRGATAKLRGVRM